MTTPEVPELDILRRDLERDVAGKKVKTVEVAQPASVKHHANKKQFIGLLEGAKIERVARKGMVITLQLDTGNLLAVRLGNRGLLRRNPNKDPLEKGTAVVITFTQHGQLRLIDLAKTCEMAVLTPEELPAFVGPVGFDLVDEAVSWTVFAQSLLSRRGKKLKSVLMDVSFIVGVGAVYSDEILFESGLRPDRLPETLSPQEIRRVFRATVEILHDAIKHGGSTIGDDGFVTLAGKPGDYQQFLAVHGREGQMTPRARGPVVRMKFGSGFAYYCEQTQM